MRRIFSKLLYEAEKGGDTMLVTVVADSGSAPRGAGAGMLVGRAGRFHGSIGGGAVEYRAEQMARELLAGGESAVHTFTLRPNDREDLGMQCGGEITVLFAYVPADDLRWSLVVGAAVDRIAAGAEGWLIHPLSGGVPALYGPEGLLAGEAVPEESLAPLRAKGNVCTADYYSEPLPRPSRVVIFGGGHIAQALAPMLPACDFSCLVLDNRPEYSRPELFAGAEAVTCRYENIADSVRLTGEDFVVIMTNGHAYDLTVESQVLRGPYAYVGVVGSARKIAAVNARLLEMGIPEEKLKTVHTPIGLKIRAVTPAEIALSILAELILCRAELRGEPAGSRACPMHSGG